MKFCSRFKHVVKGGKLYCKRTQQEGRNLKKIKIEVQNLKGGLREMLELLNTCN
jgi:hypothetical protein